MAIFTIATVSDVAAALGRPISEDNERVQVEYWLNSAELIIKSRLGNIAALDADVVQFVETEAVVAKMRNPEGFASESIDDYTYRQPTESRRVTILDEWWQMLDPDASSASASIRPGFEPDSVGWAVSTPPAYKPDWRSW